MKHNFFKFLLAGMVLLGTSINLRAADANSARIYYDNTSSQWSAVQLLGGHSTWSSGTVLSKVSNTNNLYTCSWSWGGYTYFMFIAEGSAWGGEGKEAWTRATGYASNYSATVNTNVGSNKYLYVSSGTAKNSSLTETKLTSYSSLNYTQTVKQELSTNGGSSYSSSTASLATVKVSSYKMSSETGTTAASGTITSGNSSATCDAARTATVTYSVSSVQSGYTFVGWYDGSTQKSTSTTYTYQATAAKTITARFKENQFSVSATADPSAGGTVTPTTATAMGQITGGSITATAATGYTFSGWEVGTATGTFEDDSETSTTFYPTAAGTVKANFTAHTTTVTLNKQSGTGGSDEVTATYGSDMPSATMPTRTGYTFNGYYDAKSGGTQYYNNTGASARAWDKDEEETTLYAQWTEKTHNITISNDGNGTTSPTGAQSAVGEVTGISITATPNDGFGFKGWDVTGGAISANTATTTFYPTADNATIRATFQSTAVYYDLTIGVCSSQGATQGSISSDPAAGTHIQAGTAFTLTATPATGYEVEGWYSDAACTGAKLQTGGTTYELTLSANTTVYVRFVDHKYDLKVSHQYYPNNSGSRDGSLDAHDTFNDVIGKETGYNVNTASKVRTGYYHNNWVLNINASVTVGGKTTTAEGSTATIQGATATSTTLDIQSGYATSGETVNVLDRWKEYARKVNVSATVGGSIEGGATSVSNIGYDTKQSVTAVKGEGYDFTGWTKAENTNYTINIESPSTLTTNITVASDESATAAGTITANFTPQVYTITYKDQGNAAFSGTHEAGYPTQHTYDQVTQLKGATRTGYRFDGWFNNSACTGDALTEIGATAYTADFILYAKWTEVLYDVTINTSNAEGATLKIAGEAAEWGSVVKVGVVTSKSITVTPNPGYKLNAFSQTGGGSVSGGGTSFTVKSTGSTGTVTANPVETPTVFFDNTNTKWDNVYVYLMKKDAWNKTGTNPDKGVAMGDTYVQEYHQMTQIGTSKIYYYSYTTTSPTAYIAFSDADMHSWGEFYGNNGAYRGDFADCQPMFIPDGTHSKTNNTEYYSSGRWTSYSTASEIYMVGIDGVWSERPEYQFAKETITGTSYTLDVTLSEIGHNYTFKLRKCGDGEWYGVDSKETAITSSHCTGIQFYGGNTYSNCTLTSTVEGTYKFTYDITTKKLSVEYPAMPAPEDIHVTAERYFGEDKIDNFIATDPYQVYTDETIKLTIDAVEAPTGCTTYYQFGENAASTERTYTITNPTTAADQSIEAKVFFRPNAGGKDSDAKSETIHYQGVFAPSINLTTSWSSHNDEAKEGDVPENVTVSYSAGNYSGPATVTRSKDGAEAETFFTVPDGTNQKSETYALPDQNVQRQTFVATATVNGRTFTDTKSISVYRLVEITITDADNRMNHYYMWEDGTNPTRKEAEWPGNLFVSRLGNAHIFYVKYPSYTHFVLNNGNQAGEEGAIQTVNVALPDQSTCYTIGEKITTEGDNYNKYDVQVADQCPNKLFVGDIAAVSALQGEGVMVSPQVDIDPLLDENDLVISFNYKGETGITCDQRGRSFMVTATTNGAKSISVTYSIEGAESVTKDVMVNVTSAIMIQAKIGELGWNKSGNHDNVYVHYWGNGMNSGDIRMTWKKWNGSQDLYSARVPLGTDNKVNFLIGYPEDMKYSENWRMTTDVTGVTASGCYTISDGGDGKKRTITHDGENCWTEYYVEIDMNNGTVYRSNKVEDLSQTVSFFAPGASEETAKAGLVRIICNGSQTVAIAANTFDKSGIYTAKITANGEGLTDVAYYTGDYYIRTDGVEGGWSDYKKASHKFTNFSLYPGAKYDYYWVANVKKVNDKQTFNIKACIGNEYNDNLANMIESDNYTDGTGNITVDDLGVNLRFGYNPKTNYFERAILRGANNNHFLNIQGANVYSDKECSSDKELNEENYNSHPDYSKFNDVSDWVYEKLIFVKIDAQHQSSSVLLKSKAFNGQILYQLGYTTDILGRSTLTPAEKVVMGLGSTIGKYTLRVIYDYKTNRLSATWEPEGQINDVKTVDADILFVSSEGGDVKQVTFGGDSVTARLQSLQSVMYVLEMENNDKDKTKTPDAQYWIALPFECKISDIFGIENYITLNENRIALQGYWGIMRYRGDLRAQKGWFIEDTPNGFWEWMYPDESLIPGEGYILYVEKSSLSWNSINMEEPCDGGEGCIDGKHVVQKFVKRFYFPSLVKGFTMNKSSEASSKVKYPDQPCNITKPADRRAVDSNWKVIAPKSYNNVSISSTEEQDPDHAHDRPYFIYNYDAAKAKGSRYTAIPTEDFEFQAFHGYMAQYGGTITWEPFSKTEPASAPRFAEEPSFKGGTMTIELVQNNEQLDRTFVKLSKNGTEGFDQNLDLTKITEKCAQIASVSEDVLYAGNTLPLDIELVPLNVKVVANGTYDIALEQSLEGLEVRLLDAFEQTTTVLDMMPATVTLNKGEYKDRFFLQFVQKSPLTPTSFDGALEQINLPSDKTQKLLINDRIYLINGGRVYNAMGVER